MGPECPSAGSRAGVRHVGSDRRASMKFGAKVSRRGQVALGSRSVTRTEARRRGTCRRTGEPAQQSGWRRGSCARCRCRWHDRFGAKLERSTPGEQRTTPSGVSAVALAGKATRRLHAAPAMSRSTRMNAMRARTLGSASGTSAAKRSSAWGTCACSSCASATERSRASPRRRLPHGIDRSAEQRDRVMRRAAGGEEAGGHHREPPSPRSTASTARCGRGKRGR